MRKFLSHPFIASLVILLGIGLTCQASTIAYWTFDNSTDIDHDSVATDNADSSTGVAYDSSGMFDGAANFGTLSEDFNIVLKDMADFDSTTGYTISVWYNSNGNTIDDGQKIIHITSDNGKMGVALTIKDTGNIEPFVRDPDKKKIELAGTATVTDDAWHNIVMSYDPTTKSMQAYVDGILDCSGDNQSIGTVNGFTQGKIGVHATLATNQNLGGLIDDLIVMTDALSAEDVALIHGLGRLAGVDMDGFDSMQAVKNAFLSGPGSSAAAGGVTWEYATGLGGTMGAIGGSVATGDAYVVLDGSGNGVSMVPVPEPGTIALLVTGLLGLGVYGWRKRR